MYFETINFITVLKHDVYVIHSSGRVSDIFKLLHANEIFKAHKLT